MVNFGNVSDRQWCNSEELCKQPLLGTDSTSCQMYSAIGTKNKTSAYRVHDRNAVVVGKVIAARQALPEDRYDAVVQVCRESLLTGCRDDIRLFISNLSEALRTTKGWIIYSFVKLEMWPDVRRTCIGVAMAHARMLFAQEHALSSSNLPQIWTRRQRK